MLHVSHFKLSGHTRGLACGVCILHHTGLMTIGKQLLPSLVIPSGECCQKSSLFRNENTNITDQRQYFVLLP
jgi:hypothetical protein